MTLAPEYELIRQARSDLDSVRRIMVSPTPQTVGTAVPFLESAASKLVWLERRLSDSAPEAAAKAGLRGEMLAMKRSIAEVSALVSQASDFFQGWAALIGMAGHGYSPFVGRPGVVRTVSMEG